MSRDCESCDLSHILKMKKIMCGIKMKSAIFPSHLTHKYTKVVPAHILCVCVCVSCWLPLPPPPSTEAHSCSFKCADWPVGSFLLVEWFFSGCYKSSFGKSIWGHRVLFISSETEPDESEQTGKLVVLYWSSLEAYLSTFRSVTWEQGGHELQLLHNTLLSSL